MTPSPAPSRSSAQSSGPDLRPALPGDAQAVAQLDAECFGPSAWGAASWTDEFARLIGVGGDRHILLATTQQLADAASQRGHGKAAAGRDATRTADGHAARAAVGQVAESADGHAAGTTDERAVGSTGDRLAGYVVLIAPADVRDPVDLTRIAVAPGLRRTGIGERLLAAALDAVAGRTVLLEVAEGNEAAIGLYRRAGFGEISRRRGYYGADGDALVLRRLGDATSGDATGER